MLDYVDGQLVHLLSATHTGQEADPTDFESKVLHAGMIDHVALEVADTAQVSAFDFPKADPGAALVELGLGSIDAAKPVVLVVGHNVPPAAAILDYLGAHGLEGQVEVTGICCTAIDMTRRSPSAKIVGPESPGSSGTSARASPTSWSWTSSASGPTSTTRPPGPASP